jgi:hypothetical protein
MEGSRRGISARDVALIFSVPALLFYTQSSSLEQWISGESGIAGVLTVFGITLALYWGLQITGVLSFSRRLPLAPLGALPVSARAFWWAEFWGLLLDTPFFLCLTFVAAAARFGGGLLALLFLCILVVTTALLVVPPRLPTLRFGLSILPRFSAGLWWLEMLLLLRHAKNHLPLRGPATLIITLFIAWIAPNVDKRFPLLNLRDMLSIVGAFYVVLWQVQLLTNRFGAENGTAGLLFLQPFNRVKMLVRRNVVLGVLLLCLDTLLTLTITIIFHYTQWTLWVLQAVVIGLITFTSLGNIASLCQPFTIRMPMGSLVREPENSVAFLYAVMGGVAGGLVALALYWPLLGWLATLAFYPISLALISWLFPRLEALLIAILEQK